MKKRYLSLLLITALFSLAACKPATESENQISDNSVALLAKQSVYAINWYQQSAEFTALSYQAFNAAKATFDSTSAKDGLKKAVIVDLDETMLDNSAHAAYLAKSGQTYSDELWGKWLQAKKAKALPGAVEFANYVTEHGGKMFYVSNRPHEEHNSTIDNMTALGFKKIYISDLLLKKTTSDKRERFDSIIGNNYQVVVYIGDNLGDFYGDTYHKSNDERKAFVKAHKADFGYRFIMLPNPTYGDWEAGITKGYNQKTASEKVKIRLDALKAWNGK